MRKKVKIILFVSALLIGLKLNAQQNIQFTQYIFNSISVNPAYTGYKEEWFAQVGLRNQWSGWQGAPKTGTISVDGVINPLSKRHAVGLQLTNDQLGAQSALSIYANYALRLQLDQDDENRLSLGIAGGITQYGLDGNKLTSIDGGDVVVPQGKNSTYRPDIRLGLYYSNSKWYAGVAVMDLFSGSDQEEDFIFNQNSLDYLYRNIHGYFIAGALFDLEDGLAFRPSVLLKDDFKGPASLDINAMFIFNNSFWIGAGYRTRASIFSRDYLNYTVNKLSSTNSISAIAQFAVSPKFRLGYSYDHMINKMARISGGTHEVTLGISFGKTSNQIINPRYF